MKKLIALLLALVMVLGLVACGAKEAPKTEEKKEETSAPAQTEEKKEEPKTEEKTEAPATEEDTFVIGFSTDVSADTANNGQGYYNATMMYVEELNARGGLNGQQVEVKLYDSKNSPEEAAKNANKMVADGVDIAFLDFMKSLVHPAAEVLQAAGIPMFGTSGSATLLDLEKFPLLWRPCASLEFMQPSMIEVMKSLNIKTLAWFSSQVESNLLLREQMIPRLEEAGIELILSEYTPGGDTDFSGQITRIIDADPDGVFFAISGMEQAAFIKQLRQYGYEGLAFDFETVALDIATAAGEAVDNVVFAYSYMVNPTADSYPTEFLRDYASKYEAKYGVVPQNYATHIGWDAMVVLEEAAKIAGSNDRDALIAAFDQVKGVETTGGIMDFTAGDHECLHEFPGYIYKDQAAMPVSEWIADGSYDALMAELGK